MRTLRAGRSVAGPKTVSRLGRALVVASTALALGISGVFVGGSTPASAATSAYECISKLRDNFGTIDVEANPNPDGLVDENDINLASARGHLPGDCPAALHRTSPLNGRAPWNEMDNKNPGSLMDGLVAWIDAHLMIEWGFGV